MKQEEFLEATIEESDVFSVRRLLDKQGRLTDIIGLYSLAESRGLLVHG